MLILKVIGLSLLSEFVWLFVVWHIAARLPQKQTGFAARRMGLDALVRSPFFYFCIGSAFAVGLPVWLLVRG
jgi:hypothetical protein